MPCHAKCLKRVIFFAISIPVRNCNREAYLRRRRLLRWETGHFAYPKGRSLENNRSSMNLNYHIEPETQFKVKLHYVVHYLHRGTFNHIIPDLQGKEKQKVDAYECNICQKKFKNNVQKGEYPGRGSFVCHLATEHGKILDAMLEDKVYMKNKYRVTRQIDS